MAKLPEKARLSQAGPIPQHAVVERRESGAPWRENAVGAVFPCQRSPLYAGCCGASSAAAINRAFKEGVNCPFNRPAECPYGLAPDM